MTDHTSRPSDQEPNSATGGQAAALNLISQSDHILIVQPDSPDGDSMWTALGLEEILGDLGKAVAMFSYKEPEPYLRSYEGWDRVSQDWPKGAWDLTVIVDTGSPSLIKSTIEHHFPALISRPVLVIDHHAARSPFGFKTTDLVEEAVATAEVVTRLAQAAGWTISRPAAEKLLAALMSDSLGLTTSGTTAASVECAAILARAGASLYEANVIRRAASALDADQVHLKGRLMASIEYLADGRLAVAHIPPEIVASEKDRFEPYNMIISEMQWTKGVELAAVFKDYGTKINVPLRSASGHAGPIAQLFDGGGHMNAAAYRTATTDFEAEKAKLVEAFVRYRNLAA